MAICCSLWSDRGRHYLSNRPESAARSNGDIARIEAALGHEFKDRSLLEMALTHASSVSSQKSYERLEFLGDRILGLILADEYFHRCPHDNEGQLSLRLHALARQSALVEIATRLQLASVIRTQPGMNVGRNDSILADVVESLIAALYLDAGLPTARAFILNNWNFQTGPIGAREKDAKSRLQEATMELGLGLPAYRLVEKTGPDHAPEMIYEVVVDGQSPIVAKAGSRKAAEQEAAGQMLRQLRRALNEAGMTNDG